MEPSEAQFSMHTAKPPGRGPERLKWTSEVQTYRMKTVFLDPRRLRLLRNPANTSTPAYVPGHDAGPGVDIIVISGNAKVT